jgi:hypothetical protein
MSPSMTACLTNLMIELLKHPSAWLWIALRHLLWKISKQAAKLTETLNEMKSYEKMEEGENFFKFMSGNSHNDNKALDTKIG